MEGRSSATILVTRRSAINHLERFLEIELRQASTSALYALKIIATELFDNILEHGRGVFPPFVKIVLRHGDPFIVEIHYLALNFSDFIVALKKRQRGHSLGERKKVLRYSPKTERYRGLGLMMAVSLGADIWAKKGFINRIFVRYPAQEQKNRA